ncbi:hypothetical protein P167DRAFT_477651, partial [Morchella conica CCBAS932]
GWKKEPKGRGTFSIILTSVLTLGLCVWTAIHPNVKPNASAWEKVKHRLSYVLIGMLAPELVLAVAFDEWWTARCFHREWCDLYDIEPGSKEDILRMKGAFFVTMGGVSFVVAEMVLRQDFVHYREVQDKGKAEVLGKTLVCLQALWMLVQCIVRKASGLPVTLLEIHVAMHVICAIGMYIFWFNKPQDVGEPLPIPAN